MLACGERESIAGGANEFFRMPTEEQGLGIVVYCEDVLDRLAR